MPSLRAQTDKAIRGLGVSDLTQDLLAASKNVRSVCATMALRRLHHATPALQARR